MHCTKRGGGRGRGRGNSAGCSVYVQGRKNFSRETYWNGKALGEGHFCKTCSSLPTFVLLLNMRQENVASFLVFQSCTTVQNQGWVLGHS